MYVAAMGAILSLLFLIYEQRFEEMTGDFNTLLVSSEVGSFVVEIANGYTRKIVDYESEVGINFVGPNVGDFIELTDEAVYNALKSDGSMVASEPAMSACVRGGITVGTAIRSYIPCDTANFIPGGTNSKAYARFERINLTSAPGSYGTGYSQVEGVIYIGSRGEDEPFAFNDGEPNPYLADKIAEWASIKGTTLNSTNVLTAPAIDITSTAAGAIKISFTMVRNNQLALQRDGSVPLTGDLNFANHYASDIQGANFSSIFDDNVVNVGSLEATAVSDTDHTLTLDAQNNLVLSATNRISLNSPQVDINGTLNVNDNMNVSNDLTVNDDLIVNDNITARTLNIDEDAIINNGLQADSIITKTLDSDTGNFTGNVNVDDVITSNEISLAYQIKRRGVINSGDSVADIECPNSGSQKLLASIVDISPNGRPITGWAVEPTRDTASTVLTIRLALDNGSVVDAPTSSYLSYEQWCE